MHGPQRAEPEAENGGIHRRERLGDFGAGCFPPCASGIIHGQCAGGGQQAGVAGPRGVERGPEPGRDRRRMRPQRIAQGAKLAGFSGKQSLRQVIDLACIDRQQSEARMEMLAVRFVRIAQ